MENPKKSILEMCSGAIMERVDYEMSKVVDNILDQNTKATGKRKLTVTLVIQPDDDRSNITVDTTAKSTLVATNPVRTSLYVTGNNASGEMQIVEMLPQIPGQMNLDGEESASPATLNIIKFAQGG